MDPHGRTLSSDFGHVENSNNPLLGPHLLSDGGSSVAPSPGQLDNGRNPPSVHASPVLPPRTCATAMPRRPDASTEAAAMASITTAPPHAGRNQSVVPSLPPASRDDDIAGDDGGEDDDEDDDTFVSERSLYTLSAAETALRDKVHDVLVKFDVARLGVLSTAEAERILLQLGMKPADVTALSGPTRESEFTAMNLYLDGPSRLSSYGRRDRTIVDIGVLTERVACMIEGTTVLEKVGLDEADFAKSPGAQPVDPASAAAASSTKNEDGTPKRRGSVERVFDKYVHISADDIHSVGAVKSILDARLKLIVRQWRRSYCDNTARRVWDMVHLLSILFVFITTTWYNYRWIEREPIFIWCVSVACHVLWILDIVASVVLFARSPTTQKLISNYKDIVVARKWQITLDVLAAIPVDLVLWWFVEPYSRNHEPTAPIFVAFLVLRGVKLLKVARIMTLFEIVNTDVLDSGAVTFFYQLRPIIRGFALSVTTLHVLVSLVHVAHEKYGSYIEALMFTMSMLFGAGPSVLWDTTMDYVMMMILMPLSVILRGIVIGKISVFLFEGDVASQNLVVMQDTLALLRHYDCPPELQQEILSFQRHLVSDDISHHLSVLGDLPKEMQDEMQTCMKMTALQAIPFLQDVGSDVRIDLANCMERYNADPLEVLVKLHGRQDRAFIVVHGSVDILGPTGALIRTVDAPGFVGETALLGADDIPARYTARAVSYADLWVITRAAFHRVLTSHVSVGMSIEAYYGDEHPFVRFLEIVLSGYCQAIEEALEEAVEEENLAASTRTTRSRKQLLRGPSATAGPSGGAASRSGSRAASPQQSPSRMQRGSISSSIGSSVAGARRSPGRGNPNTVARRWLTVFRSVREMSDERRNGSPGIYSHPDARVSSGGGGFAVQISEPQDGSRMTSVVDPLPNAARSIHPPDPENFGHSESERRMSASASAKVNRAASLERKPSRFAALTRAVAAAPRAAKDRVLSKQSSEASLGLAPSSANLLASRGTSFTRMSLLPAGAPQPAVPPALHSEPSQAYSAPAGLTVASPRGAGQRATSIGFSTTDTRQSAKQRGTVGLVAQPSATYSGSSDASQNPAPSAHDVHRSSSRRLLVPGGGASMSEASTPMYGGGEHVRQLEGRVERAESQLAQMTALVQALTKALKKERQKTTVTTVCKHCLRRKRGGGGGGGGGEGGATSASGAADGLASASETNLQPADGNRARGEGLQRFTSSTKDDSKDDKEVLEYFDGDERRASTVCSSLDEWYSDADDDGDADAAATVQPSHKPTTDKQPPRKKSSKRAKRVASSHVALTSQSSGVIGASESSEILGPLALSATQAEYHPAAIKGAPAAKPAAHHDDDMNALHDDLKDLIGRDDGAVSTQAPPPERQSAHVLSSDNTSSASLRSAPRVSSSRAAANDEAPPPSVLTTMPNALAPVASSQPLSPPHGPKSVNGALPPASRSNSNRRTPASSEPPARSPRSSAPRKRSKSPVRAPAARVPAADADAAPKTASESPPRRPMSARTDRRTQPRREQSPAQRTPAARASQRSNRAGNGRRWQRTLSGADTFTSPPAAPPPRSLPTVVDSWTDDEICID